MTGLQMLMKSMGVNIETGEIEKTVAQVQQVLPAVAKTLHDTAQSQQRIEAKLDLLLKAFELDKAVTEVKAA